MSDADSRSTGRSGAILVALLVGGSAAGMIGWYLRTNRAARPMMDGDGFDLSAASQPGRAASVASVSPAPGRPISGLALMTGGAGVRIAGSDPSDAKAGADVPAEEASKKEQARADFRERWREHEADLRALAEKMGDKYPIIDQYENDWMSHPDLKKLTEDYYLHGHDPVAFLMGLAQAPSLGGIVKQYAGSPWIMDFVSQGIKETPALTSSALGVISNDPIAKSLVTSVTSGLGMPPSVTGMINGGGKKPEISDTMNTPAPQENQQP
jgi:hypothetical protein